MNVFDDMRRAVREADATLEAADSVATKMAELLRGRLRKVRPWYLKQLKKELTNFNAHTQEWKD
jgi:hypothetical protein